MIEKVKLSEVFSALINENMSRESLLKAMDERKRISIYYDSPYGTEDKGWRRVEPYCYGLNTSGNMVLRAFQLNGASDTPEGKPNDPLTKIPGWRMFRIDGIKNVNFGGGDTFDEPREGYNPNDKDMRTIYRSVSFDTVSNPDDALKSKDYDGFKQDSDKNDAVSTPHDAIAPEKQPTDIEGDDDKRLADKPDWMKKFIKRFKELVNYKK